MSDTGMFPNTPLVNKNFSLFKDKWPKRECQRAKGDVDETSAAGDMLDEGICNDWR